MKRRLAKQSREDLYKSKNDYQTIHPKKSQAIEAIVGEQRTLILNKKIETNTNTSYVAFGGFFYPSQVITLYIKLGAGTSTLSESFQLHKAWNRVGVIIEAPGAATITVTLIWPASIQLSFWGLDADIVNLPDTIIALNPSVSDLQKTHLAPETFYLPHEGALALDIEEELSDQLQMSIGQEITLKKCSYCSRLLPVSIDNLGSLSFHRHKSKQTRHQNECRACKKWRINNTFNPLRTTDQLHESSVITRERKVFLKEPEILQQIKKRTGEGLKSQVWERFGRKCFYCQKQLDLKEVHLDHTRPLAYLWPIDEHATCLCGEHNNQKKDKFPIGFYSDSQLQELSKICGLSYAELCKKEINEVQLQRILSDLPNFAQEWEPRTFAATARKIKELRPDIDLYALLKSADYNTYEKLMEQVEQRPLSIGEEDE